MEFDDVLNLETVSDNGKIQNQRQWENSKK